MSSLREWTKWASDCARMIPYDQPYTGPTQTHQERDVTKLFNKLGLTQYTHQGSGEKDLSKQISSDNRLSSQDQEYIIDRLNVNSNRVVYVKQDEYLIFIVHRHGRDRISKIYTNQDEHRIGEMREEDDRKNNRFAQVVIEQLTTKQERSLLQPSN